LRELQDVEVLLRARTPLIFIESAERDRIEQLFLQTARRLNRMVFRWSLATGLQRLDVPMPPNRMLVDPQRMLAHVATLGPGVYLLYDLHVYLDEPVIVSLLRETAARHGPSTLVLVAPELEAPSDLRGLCATLEVALPSAAELEMLVRDEISLWTQARKQPLRTTPDAVAALVRNLGGLNTSDARRLVRHAIETDGALDETDLPPLMQAKYRLLDQGGVLSFELNPVSLDDIAGMGRLKGWLAQRREAFLAERPPPGLDPPKGLLLLGVQGGGKSLAAKAVAGAWNVPLLRLDFATLYNKYHGETERNLRDSLRTAGAMGPCVLWIDEIEKGLAPDSGDDGGPGRRMLGTLLTWMAERTERVFLVATANDIAALPPELLRKGRFDEIFFVDLPAAESRVRALEIHLKKRGQNPGAFDLRALAAASAGFSGAEIEQAVVSALYAAHACQESLQTRHIVAALGATKPLSVVMAEKIAYLRAWAKERTVLAD
jgi:AAA+ superfamily predicted ATPase